MSSWWSIAKGRLRQRRAANEPQPKLPLRRTRLFVEELEARVLMAGNLHLVAEPAGLNERLDHSASVRVLPDTQAAARAATLAQANQPTPGQSGQTVATTFVMVQRHSAYRNELGIFPVDDVSGRIGNLNPGDPKYAQAALELPGRRVIFNRARQAGAKTIVTLPSGAFFGFYLIQNSSSARWLAANPSNQPGRRPMAFFSFVGANPDRVAHQAWLGKGRYGFEDLYGGGDRDFNDFVVRVSYATPRGTVSDHTAPVFDVQLANDTAPGGVNGDRVTSDDTFTGRVIDASPIATLSAGLDDDPVQAFVDVRADLQADGRFRLNPSRIDQLHGAALPDGPHTLRLLARDAFGNTSALSSFSFVLDTIVTPLSLQLAAASDTAPVGDGATTLATVTLEGQAEAGATLTLQNTGAQTTVGPTGHYEFQGVPLQVGANVFVVRGQDAAGNARTAAVTVTRETPGNFPTDLTGWTVSEQGGTATDMGTVTETAGVAQLREGNSFRVALQRTFVIPQAPSALRFAYVGPNFDVTATNRIHDAFEAAVLDDVGNPLTFTIGSGKDAFFNISEGQAPVMATGVTRAGGIVTVNLANLPAGSRATLVFRLTNNDGDTETSVQLPGVQLVAAPGPAPTGAASAAAFGALPPTIIDFAALADVTASMQPIYRQTAAHDKRDVVTAELSVRNAGQFPVDAPLLVGIAHLSDPTVRVRNADGTTPEGMPYFDYSTVIGGNTLQPSQASNFDAISFFNPNGTQFTFDLAFLGRLNRPPVFTTDPDVEALVGRPYAYDADATDLDGDQRTYSLLQGPAGMQVDAASGRVTWNPIAADLGNQAVALRVEDGRGGGDEQQYMVSAIVPPPNRPPLFTSVPVVDANVATPYSYQATATDADVDTLTFSVISGPQGLSIDATTGLVTWAPAAGQLRTNDVTLQVSDGQGGMATQTFIVSVNPQPDNHPPVIVSDPVTGFPVAVSGTATGEVSPEQINLGTGEQRLQQVTVRVPSIFNPGQIDLTPTDVDASGLTTDAAALAVAGTVHVQVQNRGPSALAGAFDVLAFEDRNGNLAFDRGIDTELGTQRFVGNIASGASVTVDVTVSGIVQFLDKPIAVFVDSGNVIAELDETNNTAASGLDSIYQPPAGDWLPVVKWRYDAPAPFSTFDVSGPPAVAPLIDTNGDGKINERDVPALIFGIGNYYLGARLVALRGDTGQEIFTTVLHTAVSYGNARVPTVGDIDGDGKPEIIVANVANTDNLLAFNNDGTLKWASASGVVRGLNVQGTVTLADLDGDGKSEIVAGTSVYNYDGTLRWDSVSTILRSPGGYYDEYHGGVTYTGARQVADLDMDGTPEIVAGPSALDNQGNILWYWTTRGDRSGDLVAQFARNGGSLADQFTPDRFPTNPYLLTDGFTAVANLDDDPFPEIVLVQPGAGFVGTAPSIWVLNHDGTLKAGPFSPLPASARGQQVLDQFGPPTVADFDGDGRPEIAFLIGAGGSSVNTDTVNILAVVGLNGSTLTTRWLKKDVPLSSGSVEVPAISAFDFDADGAAEIVLRSKQTLAILDGRDGTTLFEMGLSNSANDFQDASPPVIADVDNDGNAEILAAASGAYFASTVTRPFSGFVVLGDANGNWVHARRIWNQYQYTVTNVDEDAGIPTVARNSWQLNNSQRAQASIEGLDPFAAPDLSVSLVTVDASNCPAGAITARIGNGGSLQVGSGVPVNFYLGDPAAGGTLIGTARTTRVLFPGDFEDVTAPWAMTSAGRIFVTVNETPSPSPTSSSNLSLLPYAWAEGSGLQPSNRGTPNVGVYNGIDGNSGSLWAPPGGIYNIDPRPDFYKVRFPFPVSVSSVTIQNQNANNSGFYGIGTLTFSNGFSITLDLGTTGTGTVSFAEQQNVSWIRLTSSVQAPNRASLSEFIVGGSYAQPPFIIHEGTGRYGNNITSLFLASDPCDGDALPPTVNAGPDRTIFAGDTLSLNPATFTDPGVRSNHTAVINWNDGPAQPGTVNELDGAGTVSGAHQFAAEGTYIVTVTVRDAAGNEDADTFTVQVLSPVLRDVIDVIPSDPSVTFVNLTGPLTGVAVNDLARFNVRITGNAAPHRFDLLFVQTNSGRLLGSIPVTVNETYEYPVRAIDPDNDPVTFRLLQGPAGAVINAGTGLIDWVPSAPGTYQFTVEASDNRGGITTQTYDLIISAGTNQDPAITSTPPRRAVVLRDFSYPVTATDPDGERPAYFLTTAPAGMTMDATGRITWRPSAAQVGVHAITVTVRDPRGGQATQSFDLEVTADAANGPPVFTSPPPPFADPGVLYRYVLTASDPDNDPVEFDLPLRPAGMAIDAAGKHIVWQPGAGQVGVHQVIVRARDGHGGVTLQPFEVTVRDPNTAPVITSVAPLRAAANQPYQYLVRAQDADGGPLAFQLETAPAGMTIDQASGLLSWTPSGRDVARYASIIAEDNPVGYWRLGETTGTTAGDSSGNSRDGTYSGGVTLGEAGALVVDPDTAARFVGTNGVVLVPDSPALKPAQITVEAWVNSAADNPVYGTVVMKATNSSWQDGYGLTVPVAGQIEFFVNSYSNSASLVATALPANTWTHLVGTYDGMMIRLYKNGVLAGSMAYNQPIAHASQPFRIGSGEGGYGWKGALDEVAVYGSVLSADQVRAHYEAGTIEVPALIPVTVSVSDGRGGQDRQSFTLTTVATAPANDSPEIRSEPRTLIQLGGRYVYQVKAFDRNADPFTIQLTATAPAGMTMDASGLVTWEPSATQLGANAVAIRVDDGRGGVAVQNFSIEVISTPVVNQVPVINSQAPKAAVVGRLYAYNVEATDTDHDPLMYTLAVAPRGMSIDAELGTIRWRPTSAQLGIQDVVVQVIDAQGGAASQSFQITVRSVNTPPLINSIPPTEAAVGVLSTYQVTAQDRDGDRLTFTLASRPAGMTIDQATGLIQWMPNDTQVGPQYVAIAVDDYAGGTASQTYTMVVAATPANLPPVLTSAPPVVAIMAIAYQYQVTATDPELQAVTYLLLQNPAGMAIDAASGQVTWVPTLAQVGANTVTIAARDAAGATAQQRFTVQVAENNSPPRITSTPVLTGTAGNTYRYDIQAVDPDGDQLRYILVEGPAGMTLDMGAADGQKLSFAFGRLRWTPGFGAAGVNAVRVRVLDPRGLSDTQSFNVTVAGDTLAPRVSLSVTPNPVDVGSMATVVVTASDNVGVTALMLTVGGTVVPLDANGRASVPMNSVGAFDIRATAQDGSGNTGQATATLVVRDPTVTGAPTVSAMPLPGDGVITAPVNVIGTVNDANLLFYTLAVAPLGSNTFREIARGTTPVTNGVLGTIDPSVLANDNYTLRISATNSGGNTTNTDLPFSVAGDLKLGNFTLSFSDMTVPVSGIPITVIRSYDTLNAGAGGDLGFGWRLEFRDVRLRTSVPLTGLENDGIFNGYRDGSRVYITLPGGKREGFTFRPRVTFFLASRFFVPFFQPDPGVTSRLEINNLDPSAQSRAVLGLRAQLGVYQVRLRERDGEFIDPFRGVPFNPADQANFGGAFKLTTKQGIEYQIDAMRGQMLNVRDRNGNTVHFTDGGIISSAGPQITFERDPQGHIVALVDPMGKRVRYQYDAQRDLVGVTDRMNNTTRFVYRPNPAHYLQEVIDPLGRTGARTEFDAQGRMIGITNAAGNTAQVSFDPGSSTETVLDALSNPTTYEYDTRGNIVTAINALGGITRRTYDANNNQLSETDPLGNTVRSTYDSQGNVLTETDPLRNVTQSTYGAFGNLLSTTDPLGNTITNTYDGSGNLLSSANAAGNVTSITYNTAGNQTSMTDPAGNVTRNEVDGSGHPTRQIDALGNPTVNTYDADGNLLTQTITVTGPTGSQVVLTTIDYDAHGRPIAVTDAAGNTGRAEYDSLGNRTATVDALGRRTEYRYDEKGQFVGTTYPDGTTELTTYDAAGRKIASTDRAGRTTRFVYDALGRLTTTTNPDNTSTSAEYDAAGRVTAQIDELGRRTEFGYDAAGRRISTRDALGNVSTASYDAAGQVVRTVDALGRATDFIHDSLGRVIQTRFADGTNTFTDYDVRGLLVAQTDQGGINTRSEYDSLARLTAVVDGLGQRTSFVYDEAGNLIRRVDANGHATRFEYDALGRLVATVLPLGQRSRQTYDATGNVASTTDFNGNTTRSEYDGNNRLAAERFPDGTLIEYAYTPTGQRRTVTDSRGVTNYVYDEGDRLLSRTDPDGRTIVYTYDAAGNISSITIPSGTTNYTFDALNRMVTVTDPVMGVTRYTYDAANNLVRTELANGTVENRTYDPLNRLVFLENRGPSGVISSYRYTLDPAGHRTMVEEASGRRVQYTRDALYRLVTESIVDPALGNRAISYTYDPAGNRLARVDSAEGSTLYAYDDNDRLQTETFGAQVSRYTYDADGNTLGKQNADVQVVYQWDFHNRLREETTTTPSNTQRVDYQYDADGIRVASIVNGAETRYLIDSNRPIAEVVEEYTAAGVVNVDYVYGQRLIAQDRGGSRAFYLVDALGSTRVITDATGTSIAGYTYDAFGRLIDQTGSFNTVYLYAGEQFDRNLQAYYLRARSYDMSSGRFQTVDPFAGVLERPLSLHKYLYADGNPVDNRDPSGRFSLVELSVTQAIISLTVLHTVEHVAPVFTTIVVRDKILIPALDLQYAALTADDVSTTFAYNSLVLARMGFKLSLKTIGYTLAFSLIPSPFVGLPLTTLVDFTLTRPALKHLAAVARGIADALDSEFAIRRLRGYVGPSPYLIEALRKAADAWHDYCPIPGNEFISALATLCH